MKCQSHVYYRFSFEPIPAAGAANTTCMAPVDLTTAPNGYAEPRNMDGSARYYRFKSSLYEPPQTITINLVFSNTDAARATFALYRSCGGAIVTGGSIVLCSNSSTFTVPTSVQSGTEYILEVTGIAPGGRYTLTVR
jgi:hypothetical protein